MSARARRAGEMAVVVAPAWQRADAAGPAVPMSRVSGAARIGGAALDDGQLAAVERDAFAKGYAQGERAGSEAAAVGERAGSEAAAVQGEAMLRRLMQTLEEVTDLRARMIRDTEHQMVRLALVIARRVIHREVSVDRELVLALVRVAMDRIGDGTAVTIRLNTDDYAAIMAIRPSPWPDGHVTVEADTRVPRGGCRIESDLGTVDAGVDAQLQEITRALLHDAPVADDASRI
jgi:flagellar assembly protein FliH